LHVQRDDVRRHTIGTTEAGVAPGLFTANLSGQGPAAAQVNVSVRIGSIDGGVTYAGPQRTYAGLDQVNATLPGTLKGRGQLVVTATVNGQATDMGQLLFQ
jgi:uncharacterized protein (TIGR03437 family)